MLELEHTVPIEIAGSIRAWAAVTEASGTATADEIAGTAMAYAQFAPNHAQENG